MVGVPVQLDSTGTAKKIVRFIGFPFDVSAALGGGEFYVERVGAGQRLGMDRVQLGLLAGCKNVRRPGGVGLRERGELSGIARDRQAALSNAGHVQLRCQIDQFNVAATVWPMLMPQSNISVAMAGSFAAIFSKRTSSQ